MKSKRMLLSVVVLMVVCLIAGTSFAQKIAYIHSQKILQDFKDAKDAQQKVDELNKQWEQEGFDMQKQLQEMMDSFELNAASNEISGAGR